MYVGTGTLITLHILRNLLAQKWPPGVSEIALYAELNLSSDTLLPRPHVILTYTTLCLFTTLKTWSKKSSGWFMQENLNYKYTLCSEATLHDVMSLHFPPYLSYSFYCLIKRTTKLKAASHSEMQNVMSYTYVGGFTVNTLAK